MEGLRRTALYEAHKRLGGHLVEYAGYELPVKYEGITEEHNAVRNDAGIFDVSHMGEISVKGSEAGKFVNYLVTNDTSKMKDNDVMYGMMCYENGGIVDDLLVYKFAEEDYFLVVNAANVEKDYAWISSLAKDFDVSTVNLSDEYSEVALQGPKAEALLQKHTDFNLEEITFFTLRRDIEVAGKKVMVSRTGYTGEDGFEIYSSNEDIADVFDALVEGGAVPCGLGARDTLRFEAALPLYGNEIEKDITPLEAGLGFFVKLDTVFSGSDVLVKQKEEGLTRKVVGFELLGKGIPRHGYKVFSGEEEIGFVTTGYKSITLGNTIGMAMVDIDYSKMDTKFEIEIRNKRSQAKVISKRFLKKNYKK